VCVCVCFVCVCFGCVCVCVFCVCVLCMCMFCVCVCFVCVSPIAILTFMPHSFYLPICWNSMGVWEWVWVYKGDTRAANQWYWMCEFMIVDCQSKGQKMLPCCWQKIRCHWTLCKRLKGDWIEDDDIRKTGNDCVSSPCVNSSGRELLQVYFHPEI
jgi:hypothetical protein